MPKYLLMLNDNPASDTALSPQEMEAIVREYTNWAKSLAAEGNLEGGEKLAEDGGRLLRRAGEKVIVTDGPYAESKEVLGGYFVIKASSYDDAVAIARTCPHMMHGASTLVRRIEELNG
jgi:hypothetical protein